VVDISHPLVITAKVCRFERELKAKGKSQEEIRRPRYMHSGAKPPDLEGGAKSVLCQLCPMRCGLFKQTIGSKAVWVHNVCALWQSPEVTVLNVDRPDVVRSELPRSYPNAFGNTLGVGVWTA
jgi:hypothetical protein